MIEHGEHGPSGRRGPIDRARLTMGHFHDPTPRPWWRRWWLRLRGKWPVRYVVNGSLGSYQPYGDPKDRV